MGCFHTGYLPHTCFAPPSSVAAASITVPASLTRTTSDDLSSPILFHQRSKLKCLRTANIKYKNIMNKIKSLLTVAVISVSILAGCATNPSKSHIVRGVGTGTSLGISQNPGTGLYELGFKRAQIEFVTIPVVFTNGVFVVPDVNSRYEVSTHSAVFGNAALTSTLATGTNAVNTAVGGTTPPINTGVGTGSNLTPLSH